MEGGEASAFQLRFTRWRRTGDGDPDRSLEGRTVRVEAGDPPRVEVEGEGELPTAAARRFLTRLADELLYPALERLLPRRPLRRGEEWTLEPEQMAPVLLPAAARLAAGSTARGVLERAEGAAEGWVARFAFELQLATLPGLATAIDEGGGWRAERRYRWSDAAPLRDASWQEEARFRARCRARFPDGRPYLLDVETTVRREVNSEPLPPRPR